MWFGHGARCLARVALVISVTAASPPHAARSADSASPPFRAVLAAGDDDAPVFDRAVSKVHQKLRAHGVPAADIAVFSADPSRAQLNGTSLATRHNVLEAIRGLHPAPGQACFVWVTSHGGHGLGLVLAPREEFLTPALLDRALIDGCGEAAVVVIASGCYSGDFARPPMTRPNRIVLTAARSDRPSFGCGTDFDLTVFDGCLIAAMDAAATWRDASRMTRACVTKAERDLRFPSSGPREWFGPAVRDFTVFGDRQSP